MTHDTPRTDALMEHCLFCCPSMHGQGSQVLLRSENFYLFAGLGAIAEGYIIITPYTCSDQNWRLSSLSEVPRIWLDELSFLRLLVARFHREAFGHPGMAFEHGRAGACVVGSSNTLHCYHAHLCCFPVPHRLWEGIDRWPVTRIGSFHHLRGAVGSMPYLYMDATTVNDRLPIGRAERETLETYVVTLGNDSHLASQFLRRKLAARMEQPDAWDWNTFPQIGRAHALVGKFDRWLRESTLFDLQWEDDGAPRLDFLGSVLRGNTIGNNAVARRFYNVWQGQQQVGAIGRFLRRLPEPAEASASRPHILDAGCGPGTYVDALAGLGLQVTGIDISEQMLEVAAASPVSAPYRERGDVRLLRMNALDLGFPDETFDGVWCSALLVHIPRHTAPRLLQQLRRVLKKDGTLYLSAQVEDPDSPGAATAASGVAVRQEGRIFVYYAKSELARLFADAGFESVEEWNAVTDRGACGDTREKHWKHYLLAPRRVVHASTADTPESVATLGELGERGILAHITTLVPKSTAEHVLLGIGDDCAAIRVPDGEALVATTDPCPQPVITLLGDHDKWYEGWYTMAISLSDLGAMGAKPLAMLLSIEAPENLPLRDLDRFYDGIREAAAEYACPVLGGNVKDAPRFNCTGTALGSVRADRMLRRDAARPNEVVVVLGELGLFWAGVIHRLNAVPLAPDEVDVLMQPLRRPRPRVREGRALAEAGLSRCAMDSSDGLISCFYEISTCGPDIDLHIDLRDVDVNPVVRRACDAAGIDVRKVLLSWGDWELVCTTSREQLPALREAMAMLDCPVATVGWVSPGNGNVWYHDERATGRLRYVASERFTKRSYFSHGLEGYLEIMKREPLYDAAT
jgi:thiamine-monophosphate kinase